MLFKTIKKREDDIKKKHLFYIFLGLYHSLLLIGWYELKKNDFIWICGEILIVVISLLYLILSYIYVDWGNIKLKSGKMIVWYVPKGFLKIKYEDINFIDIEPISDIVDYKVYGYSKKEQKIVYLSTNKGNYKIYCKTPKKLINAIYLQINKLNQNNTDIAN